MVQDLLFRHTATTSSPVDLLFDEGLQNDKVVRISATIGDPVAAVEINAPTQVYVAVSLGDPVSAVDLQNDLGVPVYVGADGAFPWSPGTRDVHGLEQPFVEGPGQHNPRGLLWAPAARIDPVASIPWADSIPVRGRPADLPWQQALDTGREASMPWADCIPVHGSPIDLPWRDASFLLPDYVLPWKQAIDLAPEVSMPFRQGTANQGKTVFAWRHGLYNGGQFLLPWRDAMVLESHGGPKIIVIVPVEPPCYDPSPVLVFSAGAFGLTPHLLFSCENNPVVPPATVVVPVRRVYTVFNTFTLRRVDTDHYLPALSFQMSLDWQSWTWGFSTSIPRSEYDSIAPDALGTPVELEAVINGVAYRFLIDSIEGDRAFGTTRMIRVGGRGLGAALDLLSGSYDNASGLRTANQIMEDILTVGGVGTGWTVEFNLDDWTVPAGAWAFSGTAVDALKAVAGAAGGYLQPHRTDKTLIVLPRYAVGPWDWGTLTPDYEIPTSVATRDSNRWTEKPRYNRVFVAAQAQGIVGQVTRTGTAGDVVAPTVVDPLISDDIPARQRGLSVLADTGRINTLGLTLPVLPATGIIPPGKLIRYVDGLTEYLGLVRSTSVSITQSQTRQTLEVECRE